MTLLDYLIDTSKRINFKKVLEIYHISHGYQNQYEVNLLNEANGTFDFWINTSLDIKNIENIILPKHIEKESKNIVIPSEGESLKECYNRLLVTERSNYKSETPICFEKIMSQKEKIKQEGPGMFFFSQGPFHEFCENYKNIENAENKLVHLDGLHRLLAIMDLSFKNKLEKIYACIAVRNKFKKNG
jgi:hypothetical protein